MSAADIAKAEPQSQREPAEPEKDANQKLITDWFKPAPAADEENVNPQQLLTNDTTITSTAKKKKRPPLKKRCSVCLKESVIIISCQCPRGRKTVVCLNCKEGTTLGKCATCDIPLCFRNCKYYGCDDCGYMHCPKCADDQDNGKECQNCGSELGWDTETLAKRMKWMNTNLCFICQEEGEEDSEEYGDYDQVTPCQCFQKQGGAAGTGLMLCLECQDEFHRCSHCYVPLCNFTCKYEKCSADECDTVACQKCIKRGKIQLQDCRNPKCNMKYCCKRNEMDEKCFQEAKLKCCFCKKMTGCKACKGFIIKQCTFCDKMICDKCIDPRGESDSDCDARMCPDCGEEAGDDFARELEYDAKEVLTGRGYDEWY